MDLSIIAIPLLIIAILYTFYYKKTKTKTTKAEQKLYFKGPKRKFDLKSLESRVRRRMAVST
jgi:hypothetical protein